MMNMVFRNLRTLRIKCSLGIKSELVSVMFILNVNITDKVARDFQILHCKADRNRESRGRPGRLLGCLES